MFVSTSYKFFYKNWVASSNEKKRENISDVKIIDYLKNRKEIMTFIKGKKWAL